MLNLGLILEIWYEMPSTKGFIEVDLVQAEWVVTAFLAADQRMLDVVKSGRDPHLRTGSLISGAPEDFVAREDVAVGHLKDPVDIAKARKELPKEWDTIPISQFFMPRVMSIRQAGKKANHGLNYGMKYRRFALENEMEEREASRICHIYRDVAYPGLNRYYDVIEEELRRGNRALTNCFGQTIHFMDRWGPELLMAAYAFKPQSTVGNITNQALREIYYTIEMPKVIPAAQVHDSLLNEHTWDSWSELDFQVDWVRQMMSIPFEYNAMKYTLKTEVKIGVNWGDDGMISLGSGEVRGEDLKGAWETLCAQDQ